MDVLGNEFRFTYDAAGGTVANGRRLPCETSTTCVLVEWPTSYRTYYSERAPASQQTWFGSLVQNSADGSGLMYRRNRYYNPATGLFTQPDPIGLAGGLNLYGFAEGDPVGYSDPYGLAAQECPPRCSPQDWENVARRTGEKVAPAQPFIETAFNVILALFPGGGGAAVAGKGSRALTMGTNGRAALAAARATNAATIARSTMEVGELTATHGPTLSRKAFDRLTADIAGNGIQESVKYVQHNGRNYVVDGHHRLRAAQRLGIEQVPVQQVSLPSHGYETVSDLTNFVP